MQQPMPQPEAALILRHKALPILLAHPSICEKQQILSNLLLTSQALCSAISEALLGTVCMQYSAVDRASVQHAPGLADFIAARGHILRACDICLSIDPVYTHLLERTLAAGFMTANSLNPRGLHIQAYEHHGGTVCVRGILQQLPPQHLQHLHLCFSDAEQYKDLRPVVPALAALTGLTSLTVRSSGVEQLLPAMSSLSNLQRLQIATVGDGKLTKLPASLVNLQLSLEVDETDSDVDADEEELLPPLQLSYMTQCTSITSNGSMAQPLRLRSANDYLPPNLQELCVELRSNDASVAVTRLSALTALTLLEPQLSSQEALQALKESLTNLKQLEAHYSVNVPSLYAVPTWSTLPINCINVGMMPDGPVYMLVTANSVSALPHLAGSLTQLCLAGAGDSVLCSVEATPRRLAGVISQLTNLESLALLDLDLEDVLEDDPYTHDEHFDHRTLFEAAASLPLRSLRMSLPYDPDPNKPHPATALTAGSRRLQSLGLPCYGLDDFAVVSIVCALTGLRYLDLEDNPKIRNVTLPVVAAELQQLTGLHLAKTSVTDVAVECLSKLQQLRSLSVPGGVGRPALAKALNRKGGLDVGEDGLVHLY